MDRKLEDIYDIQIAPLMQKIAEICAVNHMPMVSIFQYENSRLVASIVAPDAFNNKILDEDGLFRYETVNYIAGIYKAVQRTRE